MNHLFSRRLGNILTNSFSIVLQNMNLFQVISTNTFVYHSNCSLLIERRVRLESFIKVWGTSR